MVSSSIAAWRHRWRCVSQYTPPHHIKVDGSRMADRFVGFQGEWFQPIRRAIDEHIEEKVLLESSSSGEKVLERKNCCG